MTATQKSNRNRSAIMKFTAGGCIYALATDSALDVHDHLTARLRQLNAMLAMTYGCGFEEFRSWSPALQDSYLWGCSMLAHECEELAHHAFALNNPGREAQP